MMHRSFACVLAAALLVSPAAVLAAEPAPPPQPAPAVAAVPALQLVEGRVRESLPGATNGVAFLTLRNPAATEAVVTGVACTVARACELHQHLHVEGGMRMEKVERLVVPAQGELSLSTGGYHIMLLDLHAPLKAGETVSLELLVSGQPSLVVSLPVRSVRDE